MHYKREIYKVKRKNVIVFVILIVLVLIVSTVSAVSINDSRRKTIDSILEQKFLRLGRIIKFEDTHGGWLGDGTTEVVIEYTKDEFIKIQSPIKSGIAWKKMPFSKEIRSILWMPVISVSNDSGLYYLIDSQKKWYPKEEDTKKPINERYSFNFTLAILDIEKRRLYIYRVDT